MCLTFRLIWRFDPKSQSRRKQFFFQIAKMKFWILPFDEFCGSESVSVEWKKVSADFSVKSLWEIHWTIMFQKDLVCFSVQIEEKCCENIQNWFHTNVNSDGAVPRSKIDLTLYYCRISNTHKIHFRDSGR